MDTQWQIRNLEGLLRSTQRQADHWQTEAGERQLLTRSLQERVERLAREHLALEKRSAALEQMLMRIAPERDGPYFCGFCAGVISEDWCGPDPLPQQSPSAVPRYHVDKPECRDAYTRIYMRRGSNVEVSPTLTLARNNPRSCV